MRGTWASVSTLLTSVGLGCPFGPTMRRVDRLPAGLHVGGEQPVLVGRQQAGERIVALDHLEERLLLAEQVLVGPEHEVDGQVGEQPRGGDLGDGRGESLGLALVARLGGDVGRLGPDRERRDGQPLEHPVRVVPEQRPVLERAWLALGGVAHREPSSRARRPGCPSTSARSGTRRRPAPAARCR